MGHERAHLALTLEAAELAIKLGLKRNQPLRDWGGGAAVASAHKGIRQQRTCQHRATTLGIHNTRIFAFNGVDGNGGVSLYVYVWNTYGIRMEYAWNMQGICREYARNMHGICMERVWNMHENNQVPLAYAPTRMMFYSIWTLWALCYARSLLSCTRLPALCSTVPGCCGPSVTLSLYYHVRACPHCFLHYSRAVEDLILEAVEAVEALLHAVFWVRAPPVCKR